MAGIAIPVASAAPAAADDLSNERRSIAVGTILVMTPPSLKNSAERPSSRLSLDRTPEIVRYSNSRSLFLVSFNERLDGVNRSLGHGAHDDAFRTARRGS